MILRSSLPTRPTATKVKTVIQSAFGIGMINDIFVHINRNYTIAIATGIAPTIWPEDETG